MPNPRINTARMKAEALRKAKANKMKSKMGSPTRKTGKAKPAAAVKNAKVYKKIKSTSTYKPKFEKSTIDDKDLVLQEESPNKNKGEVKRKTTVKSDKGGRSRKITTKNKKSGKVVVKRISKNTSPDGAKRKVKTKTVSDDGGVLSKKTKRKDSKGFTEKEKRKVKVKGEKTVGVKSKETTTGRKAGYKGKDTFKRESSTTDKYGNVVGGKYTKRKMDMTKKDSPANMTSGRDYDMKMAYDKKLTPTARLHYLENERHDAPGKMKGSPYHKHGSPYHMGHEDSPMNKALVGNQKNLPEHLKKKIEAAPQMKGSPYHMSNELKYGGPVIDQMKTLSQAGASKVLRHMKK